MQLKQIGKDCWVNPEQVLCVKSGKPEVLCVQMNSGNTFYLNAGEYFMDNPSDEGFCRTRAVADLLNSYLLQGHREPDQAYEDLHSQLKMAQEEAEKLRGTVARLEELRPHWAKGYTSDGHAAQVSSAALGRLWRKLGVDNQTAALRELDDLLANR